jgi:hypothetical protein
MVEEGDGRKGELHRRWLCARGADGAFVVGDGGGLRRGGGGEQYEDHKLAGWV